METSYREEVVAFLDAHGIVPVTTLHGQPVTEVIAAHIVAEVPVSLLPQLAAQRIGTIATANPYHGMSAQAHDILADYQAGLLPEDAGQSLINLNISAMESQFDELERWIESNSGMVEPTYLGHTVLRECCYEGVYSFGVFVPLSLTEPLALRPEVVGVRLGGYPVTLRTVDEIRQSIRQAELEEQEQNPVPVPAEGCGCGRRTGCC